ncbi:hypothetical protein L204_102478 [Cryptococcus depauperatus]|nr:hypothetical protein L204_00773 [Cryptococcus depauperatus CBS 7855]
MVPHSSPSQALSGLVSTVDVNVTAICSSKSLFTFSSICPKLGASVAMIGSYKPIMHKIGNAFLKRAGKVVVDSKEVYMKEAEELIDVGEEVAGGQVLVELGQILEERAWKDDAEIC